MTENSGPSTTAPTTPGTPGTQAAPRLLEVEGLHSGYGRKEVLHGISLHVETGEIVTLMGHNGAGKTTAIRTILGAMRATQGTVCLAGDLTTRGSVRRAVRAGVALIPSERFVFGDMTVTDNLRLGASNAPTGSDDDARMAEVLDLFPILAERAKQPAGSMSGGQQRMVSLGMALMARPRLLLLDEPSLGLAPSVVETIFARLRGLVDSEDLGILLLEQNVKQALTISDRVYVMRNGEMILEETAEQMRRRTDFWDLV